MKKNDAFPGKWLKKEDLNGPDGQPRPMIVTIQRVEIAQVGTEDEPSSKPAMWFAEDGIAPMVVNSTNWDSVETLYGDDSENWIGKKIELYVDPNVSFAGKKIGGVRVRAPKDEWDMTTALAECEAAGITKQELSAALMKQNGTETATYAPGRDTAFVKKLIEDKKAEIPF